MRKPPPSRLFKLLAISPVLTLAFACGGGGGGGGGGSGPVGPVATTLLVSLVSGEPNSSSFNSAISATGRHVAFDSIASNLVAGDTNALGDVFVRDTQTRITRRVSLGPAGAQAAGGDSSLPAISADGRYVAFASGATNLVPGDGNGQSDVFVRDVLEGTTIRVSVDESGNQVATGPSLGPSLSADGRFVAFVSAATDLVAGGTPAVPNIYLRGPLR